MGAIELFYANNLLDEVEEFTKIIISELDSTYIYAYLYLERAYHEKGNFRYAMSICLDIDKLCEQYEVEVPILIENVFHTGENIFFLNDYESSSVVFLEYLNMLDNYRDPEYNSECEAYVYLGLISEHSDEKRKAEKYFKKARKISEERTDYLLKYIADRNCN